MAVGLGLGRLEVTVTMDTIRIPRVHIVVHGYVLSSRWQDAVVRLRDRYIVISLTLIDRYLQTRHGRSIVACSMPCHLIRKIIGSFHGPTESLNYTNHVKYATSAAPEKYNNALCISPGHARRKKWWLAGFAENHTAADLETAQRTSIPDPIAAPFSLSGVPCSKLQDSSWAIQISPGEWGIPLPTDLQDRQGTTLQ